jgi:hypothetical protein
LIFAAEVIRICSHAVFAPRANKRKEAQEKP